MWSAVLVFNLFCCIANAIIHDLYEGAPPTEENLEKFKRENNLERCTIEFEPCDENGYRRCDGTCNNLKYPSRGPIFTPLSRLLPSNFSDNYEPRKTKSGKQLPLARKSRSRILKVGESISQDLTMSASYYMEFVSGDTTSIHDVENYLYNITNCCEPEGKNSYWCTPIEIPSNDHVHRFDDTKCFNQTRPQFFQNMGCTRNDSTPNRMIVATTFYDLTMVYEYTKGVNSRIRSYKDGKLKVEVVDGREYPSDAGPDTTCFIKEAKETDCYRYVPNGIVGTNLFATWYWRYHNKVADYLAKLNPCWDDDKLFHVAMDITIAYYNQMLFYEFYALILGRQRLIDAGVLLDHTGFRYIYDENLIPQVDFEFPYITRWFHKTQSAMLKLYDKDDNFIKERSLVNFTLRTQDLPYDDYMVGLTHGTYLQPSGKFEGYTVDPEISEVALGQYFHAFDIPSADLNNGKFLGLAPYIQYRDYCTNYTKQHTTFEDLLDVIPADKLEELQETYEDPIDIELMAGCWAEKLLEGTWVPPTVHCIMLQQLKKVISYDRHWFECPKRPHAFSYAQLQEIRKASLAGLLCDVGDEVTQIQRHAFQRISKKNPKVSCREIPQVNLYLWKDDSCNDTSY